MLLFLLKHLENPFICKTKQNKHLAATHLDFGGNCSLLFCYVPGHSQSYVLMFMMMNVDLFYNKTT